MKWISFQGWSDINSPLSKSQSFFYACADVSFHMVSFWVVFTWYFITRNEISFLSKLAQKNDIRNEFHFGLHHVNSYQKLTRNRNETISLRPKWNLMTWDSISGEMKYFHFGIWSIFYNCLHDATRNETRCRFYCGHFERNEISFQVTKYHVNATRNETIWKETSVHAFILSKKRKWLAFTE